MSKADDCDNYGKSYLGGGTGPEQTLDNNVQAVDIKGYRVLSAEEKDLMNLLKAHEASILRALEHTKTVQGINQRSLAFGITNIQAGFMWAIRAIARPNGE